MIQNINAEKECTTHHVLRLCLRSNGEGKYGGKTKISTNSQENENRSK